MKGLYIGSMGMMTQQWKLGEVSNNIANAQTDGYKFSKVMEHVFDTNQAIRKNGMDAHRLGEYNEKVIQGDSSIDFREGSVRLSNRNLDLFFDDSSHERTHMFGIESEGGVNYTRNGSFHVNEEGFIVNHNGRNVLDAEGNPINIPPETEFEITSDGEIYAGDEPLATLMIAAFTEEQLGELGKVDEARFAYLGDGEIEQGESVLKTGGLETSNVNLSEEMVQLMNTQRKFQTSQKVMTVFDEIYEKEANSML